MPIPRFRYVLYGSLFLAGMICLTIAYQQQRYSHFLAAGNRAVVERRFDSQDYAHASHAWFARHDTLLFNQGVLAHTAGNLPQATEHFRHVFHHADSAALRMQALYNLGVVLLEVQEAPGAVELFKEVLRLNPHDIEAKFALERLYHLLQPQHSTRQAVAGEQGSDPKQEGQGTLKQAPGLGQGEGQSGSEAGQGRVAPRLGI